MKLVRVLAAAALVAVALGIARAATVAGPYDGTYQGTLDYTANVPGSGTTSGSTGIGLTVSDSSVSGSFGPVPQYGTVSFSGSVSSTGSASAGAAFGCSVSMQFSTSGSASGSVSGCTDQGGTASGSFTATRTSAPPPTTATPPTPTTPTAPATTPAKPTTPTSSSATVTALVQRASGRITVTHPDGSTETVKDRIAIRPGDRIDTGKDGRLVLRLAGGSTFELSPSSAFVFVGESRRELTLKQLLGEILYRLTSRRAKVTTVNACACVRGTSFSLKTRPGWTRLRVYEHTVDFYNLAGKRKHVLVKAGFESVVVGSKPPTPPRRFSR